VGKDGTIKFIGHCENLQDLMESFLRGEPKKEEVVKNFSMELWDKLTEIVNDS